jgi:catechol 2,3-dioxygenase-like lactoylglutathione lyase family enzyme
MRQSEASEPDDVTIDRLATGIRGHVNRFSHVVINVSDLDRAVEFYEKTLPVQRLTRINGPLQDYPGLGITQGQFEGWVLENKKDAAPPGDFIAEFPPRLIHLIEWKTPKPIGEPYREANHVGIYRQNALVNNLDAAYADVVANGGRPYAEPSSIILTPNGLSVVVFAYRDPDGNTLEMIAVDDPQAPSDYPGMMHHCNLNVTNLEKSYKFYRDIIGLDLTVYLAPEELQPVTNGSLGDCLRNPDGSEYTDEGMRFAATLLGVRSDSRNPIDVLQWGVPEPYGVPYQSANCLGIIRVALEVDDIEAARARLVVSGLGDIGPVETWDMGDFGERKVVIFKDPDGILLELIEHIPMPTNRPPFD